MNAFKFRLQALLDVQSREKDVLLTQLKSVQEHISAIDHSNSELQTVLNNGMQDSAVSASQAQNYYRYADSINHVTHNNDEKRIEFLEEESELLEEITVIQKKIKVTQKLKEKKRAEFEKEQMAHEQKFLDELGTRRFKYK